MAAEIVWWGVACVAFGFVVALITVWMHEREESLTTPHEESHETPEVKREPAARGRKQIKGE